MTKRSWFVLTNSSTLVLSIAQILIGFAFALIIFKNRLYRTTTNLLMVNTTFCIMFLALTILIIVTHMFQCDMDGDACHEDSLCYFRNYLNDVATTSSIYSFVVQCLHRYLFIIHSNKIRWQRFRIRVVLCLIQWLIAILYPIYFIYLNSQLQYDSVSYICVILNTKNSGISIYLLMIDVAFPFSILLSVYLRLFFYVRRLRANTRLVRTSKRELRMAGRLISLLIILGCGSIPGVIFQSLKPPPDYQYRIYYLSITTTSFCCLLSMVILTLPMKEFFRGYLTRWNNNRVNPLENARVDHARNRF